MDTLTLRPGRTFPQQRRICGTPSVLAFHFTPRLPEISPILWLIQRTFTSRSPCRSASATPQDGGEVAISAKNGVPRPGASTGAVEIIVADTGAAWRTMCFGKRSTPISRRSRLGKVRVSVPARSSNLSNRAAALLESSPRSASEGGRMLLPVSRPADGNSVDLPNSIATF